MGAQHNLCSAAQPRAKSAWERHGGPGLIEQQSTGCRKNSSISSWLPQATRELACVHCTCSGRVGPGEVAYSTASAESRKL